MNANNIAITGASGYIGSALALYLQKAGYRISAMGRRPTPGIANFIPYTLGANNDSLMLSDIDTLIHCAYDFTPLDYNVLREVNVEGTRALFAHAKSQGVKNFIYFSTTSSFVGAVADYGKVKYETEGVAREYGAVILRPGLVFSKNAGGIVGALNKLVMKLPCIPVIGRGDQRFFPCHLEDLCALIAYLLQSDAQPVEPVVAACPDTITFSQIISVLAQVYHKNVQQIPVPYECVYLALKLAEIIGLKTGLRSDSLKYMKHANYELDFSFTKQNGLVFRPFAAETFED